MLLNFDGGNTAEKVATCKEIQKELGIVFARGMHQTIGSPGEMSSMDIDHIPSELAASVLDDEAILEKLVAEFLAALQEHKASSKKNRYAQPPNVTKYFDLGGVWALLKRLSAGFHADKPVERMALITATLDDYVVSFHDLVVEDIGFHLKVSLEEGCSFWGLLVKL